jgi:hypothetical protein
MHFTGKAGPCTWDRIHEVHADLRPTGNRLARTAQQLHAWLERRLHAPCEQDIALLSCAQACLVTHCGARASQELRRRLLCGACLAPAAASASLLTR